MVTPLVDATGVGSLLLVISNLCMKPLGGHSAFEIQYLQYTGDIQLCIMIPAQPREAVEILPLCLEAVGIEGRIFFLT